MELDTVVGRRPFFETHLQSFCFLNEMTNKTGASVEQIFVNIICDSQPKVVN